MYATRKQVLRNGSSAASEACSRVPGQASSVLWASVMNADGAFARYNHTGCENGQGLGSQWPIRMRQGGRERDEKGPFLSPP